MTTICQAKPYLPAIESAYFKTTPADFIVTEQLDIEFSGAGEHLWVYVFKENMNTTFVAKLLAMWADIGVRDVGFSGLKDRRAQTFQWFSLLIPKSVMPSISFEKFIKTQALNDDEKVSLLKTHWHHKKLGRGTHKTNHFNLTLREVKGNRQAIDEQLHAIATLGVPNYFGDQRFGIDAQNIQKSQQFFEKILATGKPYKPYKKDQERHALLISTARSVLFNAVLDYRVSLGLWNQAIAGDVFNLDGTGSVFTSEITDEICQRISKGDIHPTAPLFGAGKSLATDDCLSLEKAILDDEKYASFTKGLVAIKAKMARRSTRLLIGNLKWQWQNDEILTLEFNLPKGSFATVVLDAIVAELIQS
ncbi:tRNA pseudouridine(13) synthase TruD [Moraxella nasovis]|uniref:tRNA pseudouridine(13) synthase TruD n=1 Tax=Moraxella nasovis TaxID=2904121 RepID=UPI001F61D29E|nr:tRNA pseudouridine(13) synthase TruD [Moraxella nasovis]UNU73115.1 tRNA pseudouridine(13) synthase TruD [Moraxella nasovis]